MVRGEVDRQVFEAFVERVLVPSLRPGQIAVLDHLSVHKRADGTALIAAVGCHLLFLPTCSADLNLIEQAFAKTKQTLRQVAARFSNAVAAAVHDAPAAITTTDAHAFFAAAGFPLSAHEFYVLL